MSEISSQPSERPHGCLLWLASGLILEVAFAFCVGFYWTDYWTGFLNGLGHVPFVVLFCLVYAPIHGLALLVAAQFRLRPAARAALILSPMLLIAGCLIAFTVPFVPTAAQRFEARFRLPVPVGAREFCAYHSGFGFTDPLYTYYLRAERSDIQRIIDANGFHPVSKDDSINGPGGVLHGLRVPENWPDPRNWRGCSVLEAHHDGWSYYLVTDRAQTRAFIQAAHK